MTLVSQLQARRAKQRISLMTHVIYGYPSVAQSLHLMTLLLERGVTVLEVQFPFSDPVADGPVITNACHRALECKPSLAQCTADLNTLAQRYPNSS
ncbi:MAG: tryptophan synthase subunit alpha, partial [Pseudomonadales bacterium]